MKLKEGLIKQGYWWLPDKPNDKKLGTLQIADNGAVSLNLIGVLNDPFEQNEATEIHFGVNSVITYGRIEGVLEDGENVILENCYNENSSFRIGPGLSKSVISSRFAFVGEAVEKIEEVKFSKVLLLIEGLDEWLHGFSGIEATVKWDNEIKKFIEGDVHFELQKPLDFELENGLKFSFDISIKTNSTPNLSETIISQEKSLEIDFQEKLDLNEILTLTNRVQNFFCFSIDEKVSVKSIKLYVDEVENKSSYVNLYYESRVAETAGKNFDVRQMLFYFGEIADCFPKIIDNWLKYYKIIEPTFNLYFSVIYNNPTLQTRFLLIAHALEFFHRKTHEGTSMPIDDFTKLSETLLDSVKDNHNFQSWVAAKLDHGNELYLAQRIRYLIEPFEEFFGSKKNIKSFIFKFCATRNCFTHFSEGSCRNACKGEDLVNLYNKSEALLQLHLLKLIEFPEDRFQEVVNRRITRKITQKAIFV